MDVFSFPPIAFLLTLLAGALDALSLPLDPLLGSAAAAGGVVLLTLIVRTLLLPVAVAQVRAEGARRRLAPALAEIRRRWKGDPQRLQAKTMELYREAGVSPIAGIGSALLQAPIVSLVYALFIAQRIGGEPNALLAEALLGVPLGRPLGAAALAGDGGGLLLAGAVVVLLVIAGLATRAMMLRMQLPTSADQPGMPPGLLRALGWLPLITAPVALIVPLAAALYLVTTTLWTLAERPLLRRLLWSEAERHPRGIDGP
ncbi:YidC/Oxa1 family membrane protein insertase [Microcella flavibacter]|uniref:YidC/Oxa1 family membrane protein insertase n=1 Tax=Microcella flavibacter TaxID=1804990 RepID=UPI0014567670|nr:membrane protein insertase YidC [Microcella flavibacter]